MKSFVRLTLAGMARSCVRGHRSALSLPMLLLFFSATLCFAANPVLIGSKKFTESYVLGEIAKRTLNETGIPAEHRQGMGGTIIFWEALRGVHIVGIDHALGYAALAKGSIDVKDAYSTDAKIAENDLVALADSFDFFPKYDAVFLFRTSLRDDAIGALRGVAGTLDEARMVRLNAEAERTKNYTKAANLYFQNAAGSAVTAGESFWQKLVRWTLRHLELAGFSLLLSIITGIPLGILASRGGAIGNMILGFAGVMQTVPSLALLALLVPLPFFGISVRTAITALFLYGLLPIVRNTASGLQDIPVCLI